MVCGGGGHIGQPQQPSMQNRSWLGDRVQMRQVPNVVAQRRAFGVAHGQTDEDLDSAAQGMQDLDHQTVGLLCAQARGQRVGVGPCRRVRLPGLRRKNVCQIVSQDYDEGHSLRGEVLGGAIEELVAATIIGWSATEHDACAQLLALDGHWDVALVDLFLLQGSGLGVVRCVQGRLPRQKVFVVSNCATDQMRERAAHFGADAVFDKSTELDALLDRLTIA